MQDVIFFVMAVGALVLLCSSKHLENCLREKILNFVL